MNAIGVDIGTTSVCAVVVDAATGEVRKTVTVSNGTYISGNTFESLQDPQAILEKALHLTEELCGAYAPVCAIGLTGQMHGILYLDHKGDSTGPLYTWQDGRGNLLTELGVSYAKKLSELTEHERLATGFGSVTHYYNTLNGLTPKEATGFCTIGDYIGMKLTGLIKPVMHISNAASLGLYDGPLVRFDRPAITKSSMNPDFFPEIAEGCSLLGKTQGGIPVSVAIGDNQASFLGAVAEAQSSILVNVGTGGQISLADTVQSNDPLIESRPLTDRQFLQVGSILCAGRAYASLEKFFSQVLEMAGVSNPDPLYAAMNRLVEQGLPADTMPLHISTQFSGTRQNPKLRGFIGGLGLDNFTPGHLTTGVLEGIVSEFYELYGLMNVETRRTRLVGSGNGLRKNIQLQSLLSKRFDMPLLIPACSEEAAYGSALFALTAIGHFSSIAEAQRMIRTV